MKEYTGPEFEIEFARAWLKYVEGGKVGVDPRTQWEAHAINCTWYSCNTRPDCNETYTYRWKPKPKRTILMTYESMSHGVIYSSKKTLVAPETEAPAMEAKMYVLCQDDFEISAWQGAPWQLKWLATGRIFLTREDAQAMSDWLSVCRKGGQ